MDEDQYKEVLVATLEKDFIIEREVQGVHPLRSTFVTIDFILSPRKHLVEVGFEPYCFGVEVKSPYGAREPIKKCLDAMWQAHSYTLAKFSGRLLAFVLIYPPPSVFFDLESEKCIHRRIVEDCMQRGNVGKLEIDGQNWRISFSTAGYYNSKRGKNTVKNLGVVRRIGSRKVMMPSLCYRQITEGY